MRSRSEVHEIDVVSFLTVKCPRLNFNRRSQSNRRRRRRRRRLFQQVNIVRWEEMRNNNLSISRSESQDEGKSQSGRCCEEVSESEAVQ